MQIGVIIAVELIYIILAIVLSLRIINLVQLEGYKLVYRFAAVFLRFWLSVWEIIICN